MDNNVIELYQKYIPSLFRYMVKKGCTCMPYPKVILNNKKQEGIFIKTGYFDPNNNSITLFINGRHPKDVLRSFAHECIHYKQQMDGDIAKSGYSGDKITEDKNLIKLEEEAYLKGNMCFRSWTEDMQRKGN